MSEIDSSSSSDEEVSLTAKKSAKRIVNWASDSESQSDGEVETSDDEVNELDSTLVPNRSDDSVGLQAAKQSNSFQIFKEKLTGMVNEHKACLKRMRVEERADNEEFFALVSYSLTGELPTADNSTSYPPVVFNGINLMQIPAGASASKFGRNLGAVMYGKNEECKLQNLIIGAQRRRKDTRTQVPESERELFELVVRRKYPKFPETAYRDARHAANQMGLDMKYKYNKENVTDR